MSPQEAHDKLKAVIDELNKENFVVEAQLKGNIYGVQPAISVRAKTENELLKEELAKKEAKKKKK